MTTAAGQPAATLRKGKGAERAADVRLVFHHQDRAALEEQLLVDEDAKALLCEVVVVREDVGDAFRAHRDH